MFSRTTIASSMSSPMASDSAISVIMFSVIPTKFMTMNDEMTEMGSVRPVITVDRHEFRKQKTIRMVSRPPMISVFLHVGHRLADEDRAVAHDLDLGAGRQLRPQFRDLRPDRVDDADGVGRRSA